VPGGSVFYDKILVIMMGSKRRTSLARGAVIVLVLVVLCSVFMLQHTPIKAKPAEIDKLEPGDILFVDLYKGWCQIGYWDHVALYVGGYYVVEATYNSGVCLTSVEEFFERDYPAQISAMRLKEIPDRQKVIQRAIDYALAQVGKPFDQIMAIPLLLTFKNTDDKFHCANLVWRAYMISGIDLDSNHGWLLYPDDIYYSPRLEPV
jgi:uncharacterized protein YycO